MTRPLIPSPRATLLLAAALAPTLTAGCGGDEASSSVRVVEELRGDTVVMVSSGEVERVRVEEAEVFWRSDDLALEDLRFRRMARVGDHLAIGDQHRVHVVSTTRSEGVQTFGRRGEGPGEFARIQLVGEFGPDTIGVYDGWLRRVSLFSLEGDFLKSYRVTPPASFGPALDGLVRSGAGMLWTMDARSRNEKALVWHDLEADTATFLDVRPWRTWEAAFGEHVLYALGSDGRVASGDPAEYCIRLLRAFEEGVRMACRERSRVPVTAGFNTPDLDLLSPQERGAAWVEAALSNPVDSLPHFDRLLFSESGDLWVQTYHEEFAHTHPVILNPYGLSVHHPLHPTVREWDVFDAEGILVRQVTLPAAFDLRVIGDGEAFGFLTLETEEIAIGRVDLTQTARVPSF